MVKNYKEFFYLYRFFFIFNCTAAALLLILAFIIPDKFGFIDVTMRSADVSKGLLERTFIYYLWDIIPLSMVFLLGLTIYIPVISVSYCAFSGIVFALNTFNYFSSYGIFFALTMSFIRLCTLLLIVWYLSYVSSASYEIYTSNIPFFKKMNYVFLGKYFLWYSIFAVAMFFLNLAQCIMLNI